MTFLEIKTELNLRIAQFGNARHLPKRLRLAIECLDLGEHETFQEKLAVLRMDTIPPRPVCIVCSAKVKMTRSGWYALTCSAACSNKTEEKKNKIVKTMQKNGGHPTHRPLFQEKIKQTSLEKYGVSHFLKNSDVKDKRKATNLAKYGVENVGASSYIARRREETKRNNYIQTVLPERIAHFRELDILPLFEVSDYTVGNKQYPWKCLKCNRQFSHSLQDGCTPSCPTCRPVSKPENIVREMLIRNGIDFVQGDRKQIHPLELDFYIPDRHIAIEVNGTWFHRDGVGRTTLIEKSKLFSGQLLHFWDFEILEKPEVVENIILAKLGKLKSIGARKLSLVEIPNKVAHQFFEKWHLAGSAQCQIAKALVDTEGTPIMVASFGRARFEKTQAVELIRMASAGVSVAGGISKILSSMNEKQIISFADRRISSGNGYVKTGFTLVKETRPGYQYVKGNTRIFRQQAMKHKLPSLLGEKFNPALSEMENMELSGWHRISDCGHLKFIFNF